MKRVNEVTSTYTTVVGAVESTRTDVLPRVRNASSSLTAPCWRKTVVLTSFADPALGTRNVISSTR
jgi:hypothetical protein